MKKLWVALFLVSLLAAFYIRTRSLADPHTMAYDTEGILKQAQLIVEHGYLPIPEPLRYAGYFPDGWDNREVLPLTPYVIAALSFGQQNLVKPAAMWYPVIFGLASIIVTGYIGRELFGDPGLLAGVFLAVIPGYLFRTAAGFCDKEALALFLIMLGVYFYVSALRKKSYLSSLFSGISFGITALGWGGYHLYILPISVFSATLALIGEKELSTYYLPVLIFIPFTIPVVGLNILVSYYGQIVLASALFIFINYFFGEALVNSVTGQAFVENLKIICKTEKTFNLQLSRQALLSGILTIIFGVIFLFVTGKDPIITIMTFTRYLQDPVRGGVHARSVAEQLIPEWGAWGRELSLLRFVYPISYVVNPTTSFFNLLIASLPLSLLIVWANDWDWEYLFVAITGFFMMFIASTSTRLFFPLMPAACLGGASIMCYVINKNSKIWEKVGMVVPVVIFACLLLPSLNSAQQLHTSMNDYWYGSLIWYKHNSQELSPLATWWDYGYWIYSVADRPSLADGSNAYYPPDVDLGKLFTETNESVAREYLLSKNTTSVTIDPTMVGKFYWVSSIGRGEENVTVYPYFFYYGERTFQNEPARIYQDNVGQQIVVTQSNILMGYQGRVAPVELVVTSDGYVMQVPNATVPHISGAIVLGYDAAIFIPPNAVNMLFTKMYFLDGKGLDYFEKVYDNGYMKTFRLKSEVL